MSKVFILSSFPYLFTLLVAIIGAQLNYLVEHTISMPLVEYTLYRVDDSENGETLKYGKKNIQLTKMKYSGSISNITKKQSFKNVQLTILFSKQRQAMFKNSEFRAIPPSALYNYSEETQVQALEYTIDHFQPGFEYQFSFDMLTKDLDVKPMLYIQSDNAIFLSKQTLATWLVRNQSAINVMILLILVFVIAIYMFSLSKVKEEENDK